MLKKLLAGAAVASLLLGTTASHALEIADDENHYLTLKGYLQPQLNLAIDGDDDSVAQDFYLRRVRLLFTGKAHENVGFFVGTLTPNIGRDDAQSPPTILGDAWLEGDLGKPFKLNAGLLKLPFSRHGAQGGGGLHGMDFHGYFLRRSVGAPSDATGKLPPHRDLGVMARGLVVSDTIDYRLAVVDGVAPNEGGDYPRLVGRLGVNFMDSEPSYFWKGTYLGKKSILSMGLSFDVEPEAAQGDNTYYAFAFDALADIPFGENGLVATVNAYYYGPNSPSKVIPEGLGVWADLGFRIRKIEPLVELEYFKPSDEGSERVGVFGGANYWLKGHAANVKLQVGAVDVEDQTDWATDVRLQGQVMF